MRLIDADKIIFREIDEVGGEYEPYLGCSKSQIDSLPTVIPQDPTTKNELGVDREDAVERLNALKQLIGYDKDSEIVKATQKSLDMAIKALEQEPVLDKIYADIQRLRGCSCSCSDGIIDDVEDILDKYKAETEDT